MWYLGLEFCNRYMQNFYSAFFLTGKFESLPNLLNNYKYSSWFQFSMTEPGAGKGRPPRVVCFCSERCFTHYRRAAFKKNKYEVTNISLWYPWRYLDHLKYQLNIYVKGKWWENQAQPQSNISSSSECATGATEAAAKTTTKKSAANRSASSTRTRSSNSASKAATQKNLGCEYV